MVSVVRSVIVADKNCTRVLPFANHEIVSETHFEGLVLEAIGRAYPDYICKVFNGSFLHERNIRKPDLCFVHKTFSHWFVVEVELLKHSLNRHVLPQMRVLEYGEPQSDCISILSRELGVSVQQAATLIHRIPRNTVVITNGYNEKWSASLTGLRCQYLSVSVYGELDGLHALEIHGMLSATHKNLGFGIFYAPTSSLRFHESLSIPLGDIFISASDGSLTKWSGIRYGGYSWISNDNGLNMFDDGQMVQLSSSMSGGFYFS